MKKILVFIVSLITCISCESVDKKFCDCMKTSEDFNKINSEILSGNTNEKTLKKAKLLIEKKRKLCFDYKHMIGEELLEKKRACK